MSIGAYYYCRCADSCIEYGGGLSALPYSGEYRVTAVDEY